MSPARIERTITRIAFQIFEDTRGSDQLLLLGIAGRGYQLAKMLATRLSDIYGTAIEAHPVHVKDQPGSSLPPASDLAGMVRGKKVVIMDDVLYSGRTMFEAIRLITSAESPEEIRVAALIDRGHRRYPVDLRYQGLYSPTKLREHVACRFTGEGEPDGVWLISSTD
jgi:pyrimidine operon attenuation protein / uracil phosphoribosyltransferase